jgi:hypothetical protein
MRRKSDIVKTSDTFREKATNCLELAAAAASEPAMARFKRMADAWYVLANEQDWLDGVSNQTTRASELAGAVIDRMNEDHAPHDNTASRKSELVDGPEEFRRSRVDNNEQ